MQLGIVGLGRMGGNMARRLTRDGHQVVALDLDADKIAELEKEGMKGATSIPQFVSLLQKPRVAWLMVPSGEATESMVNKLAELFEPGDILIDGGNSYFKDDVRRGEALKGEGYPVRGRRHQRRRLGAGARLLPDGRRGAGHLHISRTDLQNAVSRARATSSPPAGARSKARPRTRAICIADRSAPAISSRWSTTASNTA